MATAYSLSSEATGPVSESRPLSETSEIQKVYDAGAISAVWRVGEAFIKVKKVTLPNATREHVTLDYLHRKASLGFDIPDVYYHAEFDERYYIILSRLPGQTLAEAWPNMDEPTKQDCVDRIATICEQVAAWKGNSVNGVNGNHLSDLFFTKCGAKKNCNPQNIVNNCEELGMDCSSFVFYLAIWVPEISSSTLQQKAQLRYWIGRQLALFLGSGSEQSFVFLRGWTSLLRTKMLGWTGGAVCPGS